MKQVFEKIAARLKGLAVNRTQRGASAKNLGRIFLLPRVAGSGFILAVVLFHWLMTAGCVPTIVLRTGTTVIDGFVFKEFEMENVRFEVQGLPLLIQPARSYWLKRGDLVAPKWDTFEWHWEGEGAMCNFQNNISAGDCQVCDYCNLPPSIGGPPCMGALPVFTNGVLQVVVDAGFVQTENPQTVLSYAGNASKIIGTCDNNTEEPPPIFEPEMSGLYRFTHAPDQRFVIKGETNGEIKLHIVESGQGLAQRAAYQLTRQIVDGTDYWTWTIEGSPHWLENFSPNLHITDVRVLRGKCADGSAQGKQCAIPDESVPVKPSRLLFLPNFQGTVSGYPGESDHRCYNHPSATGDAFINLTLCRERNDTPPGGEREKNVVPTYEVFPARVSEKLTWFIEFNTNEGADADLTTPANDPMPADAELIIEFTIQAN